MFKHFVGGRKRSAWSPTTVAVSVGAHLLLAGGVLFAGVGGSEPPPPTEEIIDFLPIEPAPPPPPPPVIVQPDVPPPATPDAPEPKAGDFVSPRPPEDVPDRLPPVDPDAKPIIPEDVTGIGTEGDIVLPGARPDPRPPTGNTEPHGDGEDGIVSIEMVTERPALRNRAEVERVLRNEYPRILRDAGMAGRTLVRLTIDEDGRVVAGSASVEQTTHPAFRESALRAIDRFRFTPARLNGRPVSVIIAIPIDWTIER